MLQTENINLDREYEDNDIKEVISLSVSNELGGFTGEYLLTNTFQENGNDYIIAVTPAVDTCAHSLSVNFFWDVGSRSKDHKAELLKQLLNEISDLNILPFDNDNGLKVLLKEIYDDKLDDDAINIIIEELRHTQFNRDILLERIDTLNDNLRMQETEVLQEVMPVLMKNQYSYAKILFPFNVTQVHWLLCEIVIYKSNNDYFVNIYAHNPYGHGKMDVNNFRLLKDTISRKITEIHSQASIRLIENKTSSYIRRQHSEDGKSCGVIVASDCIKRIRGESLNINKPYATGAKQLREDYIDKFRRFLPDNDNLRKNFINRNLIKFNERNRQGSGTAKSQEIRKDRIHGKLDEIKEILISLIELGKGGDIENNVESIIKLLFKLSWRCVELPWSIKDNQLYKLLAPWKSMDFLSNVLTATTDQTIIIVFIKNLLQSNEPSNIKEAIEKIIALYNDKKEFDRLYQLLEDEIGDNGELLKRLKPLVDCTHLQNIKDKKLTNQGVFQAIVDFTYSYIDSFYLQEIDNSLRLFLSCDQLNKGIRKSKIALLREIELLGEYFKHISQVVRGSYSFIPWSLIEDLRDTIEHLDDRNSKETKRIEEFLENKSDNFALQIVDEIRALSDCIQQVIKHINREISSIPDNIKQTTFISLELLNVNSKLSIEDRIELQREIESFEQSKSFKYDNAVFLDSVSQAAKIITVSGKKDKNIKGSFKEAVLNALEIRFGAKDNIFASSELDGLYESINKKKCNLNEAAEDIKVLIENKVAGLVVPKGKTFLMIFDGKDKKPNDQEFQRRINIYTVGNPTLKSKLKKHYETQFNSANKYSTGTNINKNIAELLQEIINIVAGKQASDLKAFSSLLNNLEKKGDVKVNKEKWVNASPIASLSNPSKRIEGSINNINQSIDNMISLISDKSFFENNGCLLQLSVEFYLERIGEKAYELLDCIEYCTQEAIETTTPQNILFLNALRKALAHRRFELQDNLINLTIDKINLFMKVDLDKTQQDLIKHDGIIRNVRRNASPVSSNSLSEAIYVNYQNIRTIMHKYGIENAFLINKPKPSQVEYIGICSELDLIVELQDGIGILEQIAFEWEVNQLIGYLVKTYTEAQYTAQYDKNISAATFKDLFAGKVSFAEFYEEYYMQGLIDQGRVAHYKHRKINKDNLSSIVNNSELELLWNALINAQYLDNEGYITKHFRSLRDVDQFVIESNYPTEQLALIYQTLCNLLQKNLTLEAISSSSDLRQGEATHIHIKDAELEEGDKKEESNRKQFLIKEERLPQNEQTSHNIVRRIAQELNDKISLYISKIKDGKGKKIIGDLINAYQQANEFAGQLRENCELLFHDNYEERGIYAQWSSKYEQKIFPKGFPHKEDGITHFKKQITDALSKIPRKQRANYIKLFEEQYQSQENLRMLTKETPTDPFDFNKNKSRIIAIMDNFIRVKNPLMQKYNPKLQEVLLQYEHGFNRLNELAKKINTHLHIPQIMDDPKQREGDIIDFNLTNYKLNQVIGSSGDSTKNRKKKKQFTYKELSREYNQLLEKLKLLKEQAYQEIYTIPGIAERMKQSIIDDCMDFENGSLSRLRTAIMGFPNALQEMLDSGQLTKEEFEIVKLIRRLSSINKEQATILQEVHDTGVEQLYQTIDSLLTFIYKDGQLFRDIITNFDSYDTAEEKAKSREQELGNEIDFDAISVDQEACHQLSTYQNLSAFLVKEINHSDPKQRIQHNYLILFRTISKLNSVRDIISSSPDISATDLLLIELLAKAYIPVQPGLPNWVVDIYSLPNVHQRIQAEIKNQFFTKIDSLIAANAYIPRVLLDRYECEKDPRKLMGLVAQNNYYLSNILQKLLPSLISLHENSFNIDKWERGNVLNAIMDAAVVLISGNFSMTIENVMIEMFRQNITFVKRLNFSPESKNDLIKFVNAYNNLLNPIDTTQKLMAIYGDFYKEINKDFIHNQVPFTQESSDWYISITNNFEKIKERIFKKLYRKYQLQTDLQKNEEYLSKHPRRLLLANSTEDRNTQIRLSISAIDNDIAELLGDEEFNEYLQKTFYENVNNFILIMERLSNMLQTIEDNGVSKFPDMQVEFIRFINNTFELTDDEKLEIKKELSKDSPSFTDTIRKALKIYLVDRLIAESLAQEKVDVVNELAVKVKNQYTQQEEVEKQSRHYASDDKRFNLITRKSYINSNNVSNLGFNVLDDSENSQTESIVNSGAGVSPGDIAAQPSQNTQLGTSSLGNNGKKGCLSSISACLFGEKDVAPTTLSGTPPQPQPNNNASNINCTILHSTIIYNNAILNDPNISNLCKIAYDFFGARGIDEMLALGSHPINYQIFSVIRKGLGDEQAVRIVLGQVLGNSAISLLQQSNNIAKVELALKIFPEIFNNQQNPNNFNIC